MEECEGAERVGGMWSKNKEDKRGMGEERARVIGKRGVPDVPLVCISRIEDPPHSGWALAISSGTTKLWRRPHFPWSSTSRRIHDKNG